jgi:hypothetical protein
MTWHMTTLDIKMWPRGEVPGLGWPTRTSFLYGVGGWIVISWPLGWDILAQGLIESIEYSYQQGASSFLEAYLERTSKLSVLGLEQFGMGDRPGSFLRCVWVRTKYAKDSCWSVGTVYDSRELPGVSIVGPGIRRGVTPDDLHNHSD